MYVSAYPPTPPPNAADETGGGVRGMGGTWGGWVVRGVGGWYVGWGRGGVGVGGTWVQRVQTALEPAFLPLLLFTDWLALKHYANINTNEIKKYISSTLRRPFSTKATKLMRSLQSGEQHQMNVCEQCDHRM